MLIVGPCGTGKSLLVQALAHIRRKFVDVQKAASTKVMHGTAKEILDLLGLLYKVVHNIKELKPEKKVERRREQAVPILEAIKAILYERIDHVPPKSLLGIPAISGAGPCATWSAVCSRPTTTLPKTPFAPWPWVRRTGSLPVPQGCRR